MLAKSIVRISVIALLMYALLSAALADQKGNFSFDKQRNLFVDELDIELETDAELSEANPNVGQVVTLTEDTIYKHLAKGKHFVKFYNPWCVYCYRLSPTWDNLAKELEQEPSVTISKIDCTKFRTVCRNFEIRTYPTLLWIENGEKIDNYGEDPALHVLVAYVKKFLIHDEL